MANIIGILLLFVIPITTILVYQLVVCLGLSITLLVLLILIFIGGPITFYYCTAIQRFVVFLNSYEYPRGVDFTNPGKYLKGVRDVSGVNIRGDKIGVWHILSSKSIAKPEPWDEDFYKNELNSDDYVFLYLHGNSNTRAAKHRIELYEKLRKWGHVIAFDYRGYADSADVELTEDNTVADAKAVYKWIKEQNIDVLQLVIWGHSLGTAVTTHLCSILQAEESDLSRTLHGIVLEAPFTNMAEEVTHHPVGKVFSWVPYFGSLISEPFKSRKSKFSFKSDDYIDMLHHFHILILHGEEDNIVPIQLGEKMRDIASKKETNKVDFQTFPNAGHDDICRQDNFETKLNTFLDTLTRKE